MHIDTRPWIRECDNDTVYFLSGILRVYNRIIIIIKLFRVIDIQIYILYHIRHTYTLVHIRSLYRYPYIYIIL